MRLNLEVEELRNQCAECLTALDNAIEDIRNVDNAIDLLEGQETPKKIVAVNEDLEKYKKSINEVQLESIRNILEFIESSLVTYENIDENIVK